MLEPRELVVTVSAGEQDVYGQTSLAVDGSGLAVVAWSEDSM